LSPIAKSSKATLEINASTLYLCFSVKQKSLMECLSVLALEFGIMEPLRGTGSAQRARPDHSWK